MNRKTQTLLDKNQKETTVTNTYHILLAEDDKEMRALIALSLRKGGYRVTECGDGIGLLTHLEPFLLPKGIGDKDVGLIISDIRMPGLTGMELLAGKPKNEGFPPIILITAFGDKETHAQAKELGAAAMFNKPFDMDDLLTIVHEFLPPNEKAGDNQEQR
ncbi:MAG: response regulator [Deltaproteobacteria bacterium]|nr:response regulator [Deltaproteobacteria bacterium]